MAAAAAAAAVVVVVVVVGVMVPLFVFVERAGLSGTCLSLAGTSPLPGPFKLEETAGTGRTGKDGVGRGWNSRVIAGIPEQGGNGSKRNLFERAKG